MKHFAINMLWFQGRAKLHLHHYFPAQDMENDPWIYVASCLVSGSHSLCLPEKLNSAYVAELSRKVKCSILNFYNLDYILCSILPEKNIVMEHKWVYTPLRKNFNLRTHILCRVSSWGKRNFIWSCCFSNSICALMSKKDYTSVLEIIHMQYTT